MLITDKVHRRSSLMTSKKEDLVNHIMLIEHNNKAIEERLNQQAENFKKICDDCNNTMKRQIEEIHKILDLADKQRNNAKDYNELSVSNGLALGGIAVLLGHEYKEN